MEKDQDGQSTGFLHISLMPGAEAELWMSTGPAAKLGPRRADRALGNWHRLCVVSCSSAQSRLFPCHHLY